MYKLVSLLALLIAFSIPAGSSPAVPFPQEFIQPDGKKFTGYLRGDEWNNWYETSDGYLIVRDRQTGYWHYADLVNGRPVATPFKVGEVNPANLNLPKGIRPYRSQVGALSLSSVRPTSPPSLPKTIKVLVIKIQFSNVSGSNTYNFQSDFFGTSGKTVRTYFSTVSSGKVTIQPAQENNGTADDGVVGWLTLSQNHPQCQDLSDQTNIDCHENLAKDAINAADPYVDFSLFDDNGDGNIDPHELAVIIIVAGYESAANCTDPNRVWAHQYGFPNNPPQLDGKNIRFYAMFGEKHCSGVPYKATIGVMVHELGHLIFGLPDLYDIDGSSKGIGPLGVMGSGNWGYISGEKPGETPVFPSAWTRMYAGFLQATENSSGTDVNVYDYSGSSANIIKVPANSLTEYFLVTNRRPTAGTYDEGLKVFGVNTGGILIWHIDESLKNNNCLQRNDCNADENRKMVDLEEADGSQDLDTGGSITDDDFFKNVTGGNAQFNASTNPNSKLYDGSDSGVSITINTAPGVTMTIDLTGGTPPPPSDGDSAGQGCDGGGCSVGSVTGSLLMLLVPVGLLIRRLRRI